MSRQIRQQQEKKCLKFCHKKVPEISEKTAPDIKKLIFPK